MDYVLYNHSKLYQIAGRHLNNVCDLQFHADDSYTAVAIAIEINSIRSLIMPAFKISIRNSSHFRF